MVNVESNKVYSVYDVVAESTLTPEQKLRGLADVDKVLAKWKARLAEEEEHLRTELLHARLLEHGSDLDDVVFDKGGFFAHAPDYHYGNPEMLGGKLDLDDLVNDMHDMQTKYMEDTDG